MNRGLVLASFAALLVLSACDADTEEGCLTGPCHVGDQPDAGTSSSSSSSSTGGGGAGGAAGLNCDETPAPDTGDFPCEVHAVLVAHCHECHGDPLKGAPFPLLTFEDTRPLYGKQTRWQAMKAAIESGFMPLGKEDLAGDERKTMEDWFAACAPPADGMGCETQ